MNNLEFAIKMEKDGEKYYTEQAEKHESNGLKNLFLMLANDERSHAKVLTNKFLALPYDLTTSISDPQKENVFKGVGDFKDEINKIPSQLDLYRTVLDMEKKSIDLYTQMLSESKWEHDKELFEFLIIQETKHFTLFEEIVALVTRPEEWVENAEFGVREDY